jgi:hypothetical protein
VIRLLGDEQARPGQRFSARLETELDGPSHGFSVFSQRGHHGRELTITAGG